MHTVQNEYTEYTGEVLHPMRNLMTDYIKIILHRMHS